MSKFKQVLLSIAIAVVFAFFVGFGIATFYKAPKYNDFCLGEFYEKPYPAAVRENVNCTYSEPDENLRKECTSKEGQIKAKYDKKGCIESYYCELCEKNFRDVNEKYNRNVFIIATSIGIIALVIGILLKVGSVSAGIMAGAILTIIYGTIRYWSDLPDYGRFIILGIALAILVWIGYSKLKK